MAPIQLDVEIYRKSRREAKLDVHADPADTRALRALLKDWLESSGWDKGYWGQFTLTAFEAGTWNRVVKGVRI